MAELSDDERLARDWLCERGYDKLEYEPAVVTSGRRPDFFATSNDGGTTPSTLWAEVKSLEPEDTAIAISKSWPTLKSLGVPANINGHAMLHVNKLTRDQSVRALVKMFHRKAITHASEKVDLIFIQQFPEKKDVRYIEISGEVVQKLWVRGAGNGKIGVPVGTIENARAAATWEHDGKSYTQPAFRVFDWLIPFDSALVAHIDPKDRPMTSISTMSGGSSSLSARALSALEQANAQLRNAYTFRPAPGVVFLVPPEDHADDLIITTAAYGELMVPISPETEEHGEAFCGRNGAFRRDKNTHISVAIRLRRKAAPATYFPNPFAREPIDEKASLFSGLRRANVKFVG